MKKPIPVSGLKLNPKTGVLEPIKKYHDASARIRAAKSTKVRPTKRIKGMIGKP